MLEPSLDKGDRQVQQIVGRLVELAEMGALRDLSPWADSRLALHVPHAVPFISTVFHSRVAPSNGTVSPMIGTQKKVKYGSRCMGRDMVAVIVAASRHERSCSS